MYKYTWARTRRVSIAAKINFTTARDAWRRFALPCRRLGGLPLIQNNGKIDSMLKSIWTSGHVEIVWEYFVFAIGRDAVLLEEHDRSVQLVSALIEYSSSPFWTSAQAETRLLLELL